MRRVIAVIMLLWAVQPMAQTILSQVEDDWPDSRYTDHGNGTVTDTRTGLMWAQCAVGQASSGGDCSGTASKHDWQAALALAANSTLAEYEDWRLPNIKELQSLVAGNRISPTINTTVFPEFPWTGMWSSTPNASDQYSAWLQYFSSGTVGHSYRSSSRSVRLVRTSQ